MIYVRAGVYAEGPTDYDFLLPLLDRLLDSLAASLFPGAYVVGPTAGIDAPRHAGGRAERVSEAIHDRWGDCTLFVIHTDGAGDPEGAMKSCVEPGIEAARAARPDRSIVAAPCIPVREIEAWLVVDPAVFQELMGKARWLRFRPPRSGRSIPRPPCTASSRREGCDACPSGCTCSSASVSASTPSDRSLPSGLSR
jgi:hypothetical protein